MDLGTRAARRVVRKRKQSRLLLLLLFAIAAVRMAGRAAQAVADADAYIAAYLAEHGGSVDYVHEEAALAALTGEHADYVGVFLPKMDKSELFPQVLEHGSLPRKTFSMGESAEKRYYLEAKEIR